VTYGAVASGKTRLCFLAWGESGISGRGVTGSYPAGYPPYDTTLWICGDPYTSTYRRGPWRMLKEPTDIVEHWAQDSALRESTTVGSSWVGIFCRKLQVELGSNYEVGLIQCGKGSTVFANWASGQACYTQAVARAQAALAVSGCILSGFLVDIGLNDALAGASPNWAAVTAIDAALRTDLSAPTSVVTYYRKSQTKAVYSGTASLRTSQDAWESTSAPKRIKLVYDSTAEYEDNDHLNTTGNIALADVALTAWLAHPGRTS
jgi:hypothetical protein